jgi:ATP-binding cassette subfamily B multidrug efflux pump
VWKYVRKYLWLGIVAAVLMAGEVVCDLLQPSLMARIVDEGVIPAVSGEGSFDAVVPLGITMLVVALVGATSGSANNVFCNMFAQNIGNDMRTDAFDVIMRLSFSQVEKFGVGSLITRETNDVTQVQRFVGTFIRGMVRTVLITFGSVGFLWALDPAFGEAALCALPILVGTVALFLHRAGPLFTRVQAKLDELNALMQEDVSAIRTIKAFVRELYEKARFGRVNGELVKRQLKVLTLLACMNPLMNALMYLVMAAVILIGAQQISFGAASAGTVVAALTYLTQMLNGILTLVMVFMDLARGRASWTRLGEVLACEPEIVSPADAAAADGERAGAVAAADGERTRAEAAALAAMPADASAGEPADAPAVARPAAQPSAAGAAAPAPVLASGPAPAPAAGAFAGLGVVFRDVSFTYPGAARPVLDHFSLAIEPGETVAIMGATGTGKTTLASLVPRFLEVGGGTVEVGGVDVRAWDLERLRGSVAFAFQATGLFTGSVLDNVAWGLGADVPPEKARPAVASALAIAQAAPFVDELDGGMDAVLAERGHDLSGGQRQRIALARAVVKPAGVLVLDDATSALDLACEASFYEALLAARPVQTTIVVCQRIATARRADRIAVVADGRVQAEGTHEELMKTSPLYRSICASQLDALEGLEGGGADGR